MKTKQEVLDSLKAEIGEIKALYTLAEGEDKDHLAGMHEGLVMAFLLISTMEEE